jgi:hypothetical protein
LTGFWAFLGLISSSFYVLTIYDRSLLSPYDSNFLNKCSLCYSSSSILLFNPLTLSNISSCFLLNSATVASASTHLDLSSSIWLERPTICDLASSRWSLILDLAAIAYNERRYLRPSSFSKSSIFFTSLLCYFKAWVMSATASSFSFLHSFLKSASALNIDGRSYASRWTYSSSTKRSFCFVTVSLSLGSICPSSLLTLSSASLSFPLY